MSRVALVGFVVFLSNWCSAQERTSITPRARPEVKAVQPSTFRLDAWMVQIPVTVTDSRDRPQMDLHQSDFHLYEDGLEQQISAFSMAEAPISTGVVFDTSGSMKPRIQTSREALELLLQSSGPQDEFFLTRFSDKPELLSAFTHDPGEISRRLGTVVPHGWTALYDAMFVSLEEMRHASNSRKALLVLSDGEDNNSRYSEGEVLSRIRESDVRVYAIGLFRQTRCLEKMADETGGRMIWVHKLDDLPDAIRRLGLEMRNVYMLSYFSRNPPSDGKYRKVRVDVDARKASEPLHVTWRRGYYAPVE
jgi:Ca-activated chloride channel family protein